MVKREVRRVYTAPGMIEENFKDSYTIGFHVGEVAGQTVMRCHCHVIPRYVGEVQEPGGRVRGVTRTDSGTTS